MTTRRFRSSEILALVGTAMLMVGSASAPADPIAGRQPDVGPFRLESAPWSEPYSGPLGVPKGAQRAVLGVDPKTKGETYYAHFPAGSHFALHWHAYAEYAVVLRGSVVHILGARRSSLQTGDYVVIPRNVNHGWEVGTAEDVYILIRRDGPSDQHFVEP
jgi:quercetin dioxygenase-like cupin family protein